VTLRNSEKIAVLKVTIRTKGLEPEITTLSLNNSSVIDPILAKFWELIVEKISNRPWKFELSPISASTD